MAETTDLLNSKTAVKTFTVAISTALSTAQNMGNFQRGSIFAAPATSGILTFYASNGGSYVQLHAANGSAVFINVRGASPAAYPLPSELFGVNEIKIGVGVTLAAGIKQAAACTFTAHLFGG